eukprot:653719-Pyramimonas_sp.AAC.1
MRRSHALAVGRFSTSGRGQTLATSRLCPTSFRIGWAKRESAASYAAKHYNTHGRQQQAGSIKAGWPAR